MQTLRILDLVGKVLVLALMLPVSSALASSPPLTDAPPEGPTVDASMFDEIRLTSGEILMGDITVFIPGQYLVYLPLDLADAPERIDASQIASVKLSLRDWGPDVDNVAANNGAFVIGEIVAIEVGESIAIVPYDQLITRDPVTQPYEPITFAWKGLRAYFYQNQVTFVAPVEHSEEQDRQDQALADALRNATLAKVHIQQSAGATPVALERISDENPDDIQPACTKPCDSFLAPGTYRIGGADFRPSKPFVLEPSRSYTLDVDPSIVARRRGVGLAVGGSLALLGLIGLVVPATVDMPMKYAYPVWAGSGAMVGLGIGVGVGISFGRTKVELSSVLLPRPSTP